MSSLPPEITEFTPEQRKLLARAYRLILSWPHQEKTKGDSDVAGSVTRPAGTSNHSKKKPSKKKGN
jgi:hypothetical protein